MNKIIFDCFRRWRWGYVQFLLLTTVLGLFGQPYVLAPLALIFLFSDLHNNGIFRVVRPLPVTAHAQARAWWFVGVVQGPLLSLPVLAAGLLLHQKIGFFHMQTSPVPAIAPLFAAAAQAWTAFGCAAAIFLGAMFPPNRRPRNAAELAARIVLVLLWMGFAYGIVLLLPKLPRSPAATMPWHLAVFATVPVCAVLSFLAAPRMMHRRSIPATELQAGRPMAASAPAPGLTGLALYLAIVIGRMLGILVVMMIVLLVAQRWVGGSPSQSGPGQTYQLVVFPIYLAVIMNEGVGFRVLRMLPLSTTRLSLLLLCTPWVAGLGSAVVIVFGVGIGNPGWPPLLNVAAQAVAFGGCGALTLALTLLIPGRRRQFVCVAISAVPAIFCVNLASYGEWIALAGAIMSACSYGLIHRSLRKSSAVYQPRPVFGIGGRQLAGAR